MKTKIMITEEQLQNLLHVVKEENFDDFFDKYEKDKREMISMSHEDATMLINMGLHWCKDKPGHPDCEEIYKLRSKLDLYD
ncbi:MAG TPA: hypothetical protein PK698_02425 [Bacilli bacterium]|jgi:hypothetical protein|nr:MAG: hypothetical protein BWX59_02055 [Bacteroidetes bacterium ADurb.Bin028]HOH61328.1 hypothetical protein [Bacilli bacterium]